MPLAPPRLTSRARRRRNQIGGTDVRMSAPGPPHCGHALAGAGAHAACVPGQPLSTTHPSHNSTPHHIHFHPLPPLAPCRRLVALRTRLTTQATGQPHATPTTPPTMHDVSPAPDTAPRHPRTLPPTHIQGEEVGAHSLLPLVRPAPLYDLQGRLDRRGSEAPARLRDAPEEGQRHLPRGSEAPLDLRVPRGAGPHSRSRTLDPPYHHPSIARLLDRDPIILG